MPKECAEIQKELPWLFVTEDEGRLLGEAITEHLAGCGECRREADRLRGLLGSLGAEAVPDPGEPYWQAFQPRLRERIAGEEKNALRQARASWIWALAATAASFLFAGVAVGRWIAPAELLARMRLEREAKSNDPERLLQVLDTLLSRAASGVPGGGRTDTAALAADMEQALEVVFPEDDSEFFDAADDLTPEQRQRLAKSLDPGWV